MKITKSTIDKVYRAHPASVETMELKGYRLVKELFVDSSGFGLDSEPALTREQFTRQLEQLLSQYGELTAKITGAGMFQVYIGLFTREGGNKQAKICGNNTLEVDYGNYTAIRLHDTDILEFHGDKITLNSGGWRTRTTKERINQYLPNHLYLYQKNYEWFVENTKTGEVTEFEDGVSIAV